MTWYLFYSKHQAFLGRNDIKSIGAVSVGSGFIKIVLPQDYFQPKYFASYKLVLSFNSVVTTRKLLELERLQDGRSVAVARLDLFYASIHACGE